jgi:NAD(P)H-dependent FMN reductase
LKNALDHIYAEWNRKPVSFVSYGGPGGGLRAVQQLRQVAVELELAPLRRQVSIPAVYRLIDDQGRFQGAEDHEKAADALLTELVWWANALRRARTAV